MRTSKRLCAALAILAFSATTALAEMPAALKGTWILDAEATATFIRTSPKWDAEDEKHLPMILKRMAQMCYIFEGNAITVAMRGKAKALPVVLKSSEEKTYVFDGTVGDQAVAMTVSFVNDTTINIRSSATDDGDYFLWKRGEAPVVRGPSDQAVAAELMKKALQDGTAKPAAPKDK